MLELGKAGGAGTEKCVLPVLRDGELVVASCAAHRENATAAVDGEAVVGGSS